VDIAVEIPDKNKSRSLASPVGAAPTPAASPTPLPPEQGLSAKEEVVAPTAANATKPAPVAPAVPATSPPPPAKPEATKGEKTNKRQGPLTIAEVRPNGTALVKGEKRLELSQGQEWVQVSGIVRLGDLDAENRVRSTQVADARVTYSGNGSIGRASREGWLSKFFGMITPF
jgi:hypothetical protein